MNIQDLIDQISAVAMDFQSGDFLQAWGDSITLQQTAYDLAKQLTSNRMQACAPAEQNALKFACSNCLSACVAVQTAPPVVGASVGGIFPGDGTFLKNLADVVVKLLPIIISLFAKPAPTP